MRLLPFATVFLRNASYKDSMTDKSTDIAAGAIKAPFTRIRDIFTAMANNPWGPSKGGSDDAGDGASDGEKPAADGPKNPWAPRPDTPKPARGGGGGRGPNVEDLFKRGGGGGGFPRIPLGDGQGRKFWGYVALAIVALWLFSTSVWRLGTEERGVVTQFGAYNRTVGEGINLTLPFPFERLEKVDSNAIRTTKIGTVGENDDNLVLTGDQNIIDLAYEIRWTVKDPRAFLFVMENPEATVQEVGESAMRAVLANFKLTDAIGPKRGDIEAQSRSRMQEILDSYGAGIEIRSVTILESDPPSSVKEAFRSVNAAQQQRESYINQARAYAQQQLERAEGDATSFNKVYEQYRLSPEVTRRRMYYETMEGVLQGADKTVIEANGVTPYLPLPEAKRRSIAPPEPATSTPAKGAK
jgi:modulator of FtsH protease HflK